MKKRATAPVREVLDRLRRTIPDPGMELSFSSPYELLVATVLSAQTTDKTVNRVTPVLFSRFPTPEALSRADPEELRSLLRPTGFYQRKADHVRLLAKELLTRFGGQVPSTMEDLLTLPGVGRKTASVVLAHAFHVPAIFVDTHVGRVTRRLGWTDSRDPGKIEQTLSTLIPREEWIASASRLLLHGRYVCLARAPLCSGCTLEDICPSANALKGNPDSPNSGSGKAPSLRGRRKGI